MPASAALDDHLSIERPSRVTGEAPTPRRIADFPYIGTTEGWLYPAVVIDLFSGPVDGWSLRRAQDRYERR